MSANVTKGHVGYMEIGTAGSPATGVIKIPYMSASPMNPSNDTYMPSVNKSVGPSIVVRGIYTPGITVRTIPLESWFTADNLNAMFVTGDANYDTAPYAAHLVEPGGAELKIGGLRWGALSLTHSAAGGMLGCEIGGICTTFADTSTWSGSGSTVAGQAFGPSQVNYTTATKVRGWSLNIIRAQAYDIFSGGDAGTGASVNVNRFPSGTSTGQIGGTFSLEFSPAAGYTIPTSGALTITLLRADNSTTHLTIGLQLNLDAPTRSYTTGFGTQVNTYTLINTSLGGSPVTFT